MIYERHLKTLIAVNKYTIIKR